MTLGPRALCTLLVVLTIGALGPVMAAMESEPVVLEVGSDGIQHGRISLDSYSYAPKFIVVQAGIPVELTLTSVTLLTPHNFVLKEPGAGLSVSEDVSAG